MGSSNSTSLYAVNALDCRTLQPVWPLVGKRDDLIVFVMKSARINDDGTWLAFDSVALGDCVVPIARGESLSEICEAIVTPVPLMASAGKLLPPAGEVEEKSRARAEKRHNKLVSRSGQNGGAAFEFDPRAL